MNKNFPLFSLLLTVALFLVGCEKSYEIETDDTATRSAQLMVTASADSDTTDGSADFVTYPVNVYLMNKKGKCVSQQSISSATDKLSVWLEKGNYDVYAVGAANLYTLPAQDALSKTDTILPKNNAYGDLQTAYCNVQMADGETNSLNLLLQRRVLQVESVTLKSIPTDITGVTFTVSPLYDGIRLDGDYTSGTSAHTFSLTKQADGTTWQTTAGEYILPANNAATFKVSLQHGDSATAYSYACSETLEANHKVTITGTFVDDEHVTLSGTLAATDWAEPVFIDFSFNSSSREGASTEKKDDTETNTNGLHGGAPAAGTAYKGCYVLRTENVGDTTFVTLITPTEKNNIKVSSAKDTSTRLKANKENAQEALNDIKVSGINGWRFPTLEEVQYLWNNVEEVNKNIAAIENVSINSVAIKNDYGTCGYYYIADDNYVYICTSDGKPNVTPAKNTYYKVRGFATKEFYEE